MSRRLLFIEEAPSLTHICAQEFSDKLAGVICEHATWASLVPERLLGCGADLIVPVVSTAAFQAAGLFRWLRQNPIDKPTLAILPEEHDAALLLDAAEIADDFIIAPVRVSELIHRIGRILGNHYISVAELEKRLTEELSLAQLVGRDPAFLRTVEKIPLIARSNSPVVITGETGTGKELCARAIHQLSPRRDFPFVPVDCASFPDHLFENEMFGHARGAFTDAHRDQKGLIALAEGGTILLDEVDSLSPRAQSKLLRFLQERTYRPLGADRFARANVNIIAATNRDLEALVRSREFRADLFFRLNVLRLCLVPLRERRSDIALLAAHFLDRLSEETGTQRKSLTPAAMYRLQEYDWPGNVRELYNVIQSAVVFSEGTQIMPSHISSPARTAHPEADGAGFREARSRAIEAFERRYVEQILREAGGNVTRAARIAQKDRRAFGRLIKRYNINRDSL